MCVCVEGGAVDHASYSSGGWRAQDLPAPRWGCGHGGVAPGLLPVWGLAEKVVFSGPLGDLLCFSSLGLCVFEERFSKHIGGSFRESKTS